MLLLIFLLMFGNKINKDKLLDFLFTYFTDNAKTMANNPNSGLNERYLGRMEAITEVIKYLDDIRK